MSRRRAVRVAVVLGLVGAAAYAWWRATEVAPVADSAGGRDPEAPVRPAPAWVPPDGGACPASHPVKAKLASGIYHQPGGASYERTTPDRCYRDGAQAEADGLRRAKR